MRKILNKMFKNKKLSIFLPIAIAVLLYLMFIVFGTTEDKIKLMISTLIQFAVCFFAMFLIVFIQVKNSICPEWFLNLIELFFIISSGIYAIVGIVIFVVSGFQNLNDGTYTGFIIYSAVSWAHSMRTK